MFARNFVLITIISCILIFVQGSIKQCDKVHPPGNGLPHLNCTIVCSSRLLAYVTGSEDDELPLCFEDLSALTCDSHDDCRKYYAGATCRKIPCACEAHSGTRIYYMVDSKFVNQINSLRTCTVSTKWLNPDQAIYPFPWKTLLVVFGIVASFSICLIAVRYISPYIRAMQAKTARNRRSAAAAAEEGQPFTSTPSQTGRPRVSSANRPARVVANPNHRFYRRQLHDRCMQALNSDKPPPYEVAIQEPPSYENVNSNSCSTAVEAASNRTDEDPPSAIAVTAV